MLIPPPHTQEIQFDNGSKLTLRNVQKIETGNWTHIIANGGKEYITNTSRILFVKVYSSDKTDYEHKKELETLMHSKDNDPDYKDSN